MKMNPEHYNILCDAINKIPSDYIEQHKKIISEDSRVKDFDMRLRWDLLYISKRFLPDHFICDVLYKYLSDNHIDTALKSIMKESK